MLVWKRGSIELNESNIIQSRGKGMGGRVREVISEVKVSGMK